MTDAVAWISAGISAGSLAVAVVAIVKSNRAQREANAVQHRMVEIEERRENDRIRERQQARLVALGGNEIIRIENRGLGDARQLVVLADGVPFAEHERIKPFDPVVTHDLAGQSHFDYQVVSFDGAPPIAI